MKTQNVFLIISLVLFGLVADVGSATARSPEQPTQLCVHQHAPDKPEVPYSLREMLTNELACKTVIATFESWVEADQVLFVNLYGGIEMSCVNTDIVFTEIYGLIPNASTQGAKEQLTQVWEQVRQAPCALQNLTASGDGP